MSSERDVAVEVETRIRARPETVFAFLVDSDRYIQWQGSSAELDARPGGIYRVVMPNGAAVRGTYLAVEPPNRVVFTWGWEGDDLLPPGGSTVEITLTADGDETVLRLRHTDLPSVEPGDQHAVGWRTFLAGLADRAEQLP